MTSNNSQKSVRFIKIFKINDSATILEIKKTRRYLLMEVSVPTNFPFHMHLSDILILYIFSSLTIFNISIRVIRSDSVGLI